MRRNPRLLFFGSLFTLALAGGTVGFHFIEGLEFFDAFYFSIITMATVGYGDIHPWSTEGKALAIVLVFAGVGSFVGVVEAMAESVISGREERAKREKRNMIRGIFFSDVGLELLGRLVRADGGAGGVGGLRRSRPPARTGGAWDGVPGGGHERNGRREIMRSPGRGVGRPSRARSRVGTAPVAGSDSPGFAQRFVLQGKGTGGAEHVCAPGLG